MLVCLKYGICTDGLCYKENDYVLYLLFLINSGKKDKLFFFIDILVLVVL